MGKWEEEEMGKSKTDDNLVPLRGKIPACDSINTEDANEWI